MEKDKSAVNEFLGDLNNASEKDPLSESKEDLLFGNQPAKEEPKEETIEKEEKIPFHKDPKVQRFIEKEISKRMSEYKPQSEVEKFVKETETDEITDVLTRIIGNDTPEKVSAIKDFRKVLLEREEMGAQKALDYFSRQREKELQEEREAERELQEGFESIEETFDVDITSNTPTARKTRSEFIDFIKRIAPKDSDGDVIEYPDFTETFELFRDMKKSPEPNNRAKDLASRSMSRPADVTSIPQQEDKSWNAVERILSKLTG